MAKKSVVLIPFLWLSLFCQAQPWFPDNGEAFNTEILPRIDIEINEDSLEWIYDNISSDHEFKAKFTFSTSNEAYIFNNVGFRLRGNTSRRSDKKSFKVSFNTFESGRKFQGLEKMNLNGEHNDPSVIRSYLAWNTFSYMKVPCPRSNHVDLYINNRFYGLYINVEHIDEEFIESRFSNKLGNLYKCLNPASLAYLGSDKEDYKNNGYTLKTNTDKDDYADLISFVKTLNNSTAEQMPQKLEPIFNINGFIRYLVAEIFTGHWDGYSGNKNNYYLYHNYYTQKIEFVPYDVDNTYGIDWFGIDWANRDIYRWWSDWEDMPLTSKIFGNKVYKDRFSFLLNELITKYVDTDSYFIEIDAILDKIKQSAQDDPYRPLDYSWTYTDFLNSYDEALGAHVKYGLKHYITARINSIKEQLILNPIAPIIENVYHNFPAISEHASVKVDICDDEDNLQAKLFYSVNGGEWSSTDLVNQKATMFTGVLPALNESGYINYYIEAIDKSANKSREPYEGSYTIQVGSSDAQLVINEFMASNQNTITDNYGENEDWIEIYNAGSVAVNLSGKYLTDDLQNKTKWGFPNITLNAGQYYIIWADDDTEQGLNHANFKLSASGECIGIFDSFEAHYAAIDTIRFDAQDTDVSFGRKADGALSVQTIITPGGENESTDVAFITFTYNMQKKIKEGDFLQNVDFIDIVGTFNNWEDGVRIYDGDDDGLHTATLFGFKETNEIQYKARINGDWDGGEFSDLGDSGNRQYILESGPNLLSHLFNDEPVEILSINKITNVSIYPNPVNDDVFTVKSENLVQQVFVYAASGALVELINGNNSNVLNVSNNFNAGVYIIKVKTKVSTSSTKIVVY